MNIEILQGNNKNANKTDFLKMFLDNLNNGHVIAIL